MMAGRRDVGLGLAATVLGAHVAKGQAAYPTRPVTIISPFAPGGQSDPIARVIAQHLQQTLGQPFVIENRSGAGSTIGAAFVAGAAADGHTLLFGTTSTYVIAPFVYRSPGYDPVASFAPVTVASEGPMILCTNPRTGFRSAADLVAAARRSPGTVTFASAGNGTFPHVLGQMLAGVTGVELIHVPYRGGAPAMNDLIGGQVDVFFEAIANVAAHAESGRVVPLMSTGGERSSLLPTVPTAAELGYPALALRAWTGFAAPAATPPAVVAILSREIGVALRRPEAQALLARLGATGVGGSPDDMARRIAREAEVDRSIVTRSRVTAD